MKKTKVKVRAYNCDFEIDIIRNDFYNVMKAQEYVQKEIIDTAIVISVTYFTENGEITFNNINYLDPNYFINRMKDKKNQNEIKKATEN